jgi:hypothetical protein
LTGVRKCDPGIQQEWEQDYLIKTVEELNYTLQTVTDRINTGAFWTPPLVLD